MATFDWKALKPVAQLPTPDNGDDVEANIRSEFKRAGLDPDLGVAIAAHESGLKSKAVNNTGGDALRGGSYGAAQMSMLTAKGLGFTGTSEELMTPAVNAHYQAMLVKQLSTQHGGDLGDIVAAYNSGKPLAESPESTRNDYVPDVMRRLNQIKAMVRPDPDKADQWTGVEDSPVTASLMVGNIDFAKTAKNHVALLRGAEQFSRSGDPDSFRAKTKQMFKTQKEVVSDIWEDMKGSFLDGKSSAELLDLRAKEVMGTATQDESIRAATLSIKRKPWLSPNSIGNDDSITNFVKETPGVVSKMAGGLVGDWKSMVDTVGASALFGAAAGSVAPVGGTLVGAGAGAVIGLTAAMGTNMAKTAMGEFYDSMLRVKGVDPQVARGAALVLGGVNGALGLMPFAGVMSESGLTTKLLGPEAGSFLARLAGDPAAAKILSRIAAQFATGMGANAVIGGLQELNTIAAEGAVQYLSTGVDDTPSWGDIVNRVGSAARGGAQLGAGLGVIEAGLHRENAPIMVRDADIANTAKAISHFDNAGMVVQQVFQEDRDKAKTFYDKLAQVNGEKDITFPKGKLEQALNDIGLEGENLKAVLPEVAKQLEATQDSKAEIQMTHGDVAGYLAPHDTAWEAFKPDMRSGARGFTLNELRDLTKNVQKDMAAVKPLKLPKNLQGIYDDIYGQLSKMKALTGNAAEKAATLYTSAINAIAQDTGGRPEEIHKKWGVKFVQVPEAALDERAAGVPGATVTDTGKYRVMSLDNPIPAKEFGTLKQLDDLRNYTSEDKGIEKTGTYGELFARLKRATGSSADAAKVLGSWGWDGIDTGMTKRVWRPDAILPKADPLKITRGMTDFKVGRTTIAFSEHANVATVAHELGHLFLRMWRDVDMSAMDVVTQSKNREATLAAVTRQTEEFKKAHDARNKAFDEAQKARVEEYEAGKKANEATQRRLDSEKFQAGTLSEGSDLASEEQLTGADYEKAATQTEDEYKARLARQGKLTNEIKAEHEARDKSFAADQAAKAEEHVKTQDRLAKSFDNRMEALKAETNTKIERRKNPSQVADSFSKLMKYLGENSDGSLSAASEEKFARAFVDYLRTGEPPTVALRPVFGAYKGWLTMLYGHETALGAKLSPEIIQVFDKLVASQKAMDFAKKNFLSPAFTEKEHVGMTDQQFENYKNDLKNAADTAQSEIEREIFSHMSQEGIDAFEKHKVAVREKLIATDSTHSLVSFLKTGERLDNGSIPIDSIAPLNKDKFGKVLESHKLDTQALERMGVGKDTLMKLSDMHEQGGLDPALVARVFGHNDSHDMLSALQRHTPLEQAVSNVAASEMPGWVDPTTWLRGRAVEKMTGGIVPHILEIEYKAFGGKETYEVISTAVKNALRGRKISTLDPNYFLREYHRLTEELGKAKRDKIAAGLKLEGAGQPGTEEFKLRRPKDPNNDTTVEVKPLAQLLADKYKGTVAEWEERLKSPRDDGPDPRDVQRQRIQAFAGWQIARQSLEDMSQHRALGTRLRDDFMLRSRIADKAGARGPEFIAGLDAALEALGFREPETPTVKPIGKFLSDWQKRGADIVEDPELENRAKKRTGLSDLNINDLRNSKKFLESLYNYITKDAVTVDMGSGAKPLESYVARLVKNIYDLNPLNRRGENNKALEAALWKPLRGLAAQAIKAEFLIRHLDNQDPHGELAKAIFQPIVEAESRSAEMRLVAEKALREHVATINDGSLAGDSTLRVRDREFDSPVPPYRKMAAQGRTLSKTELMSALLNFGSEKNRKALLEGYGITERELLDAVSRDFDNRHLQFANKFWALHEQFYPEVAKTYAKRTGIPLEAVKAIPFTVKSRMGESVEMTGGYIPIRYGEDARFQHGAFNVNGFAPPDLHVNDDMTMERKGSWGALELSLPRVLGSLEAKIHYASMYDAVQQVNKVISHPDFQRAVKDTVGGEFNKTLFQWLQHEARDGIPLQPLGKWDKIYRYVMTGASQAAVGFNHITAALQPFFGGFQAKGKIDAIHMTKATIEVMSNWRETWKNALEESNELWRMGEDPKLSKILQPFVQDISVPLATKIMEIGHGDVFRSVAEVKSFLSELGMAHQQNTRQFAGLIAYEAAKLQAMKLGRPDVIEYADAMLRQTIGGTGAKDTPNLLAQPGLARSQIMYYSHRALIASEVMSRIMEHANRGFTRDELMTTAKTVAFWLVMPAVAKMALKRDTKDAPDDPVHAAGWFAGSELAVSTATSLLPIGGDVLGEMLSPGKSGHGIMSGPMGQLAGDVRSTVLGLTDSRHPFTLKPLAGVASFAGQIPAQNIWRDLDLIEGAVTGRYGNSPTKWYDVYARGAKKEGFR